MGRKAIKKPAKKEGYKYVTSEVEAAYRVKMNPDPEKYATIKEKVHANNGYCPSRSEKSPDTHCMCKQFKERDSEGWCKCRLFYKEARTPKDAADYMNSTFTANEKREKELEKQLVADEKRAKKEAEAMNE